MVCLSEDLRVCIAQGQLTDALDRLGELMRSKHHRPGPAWQNDMLADIFQAAVQQEQLGPALRVIALTADRDISRTRCDWVMTRFADLVTDDAV